MTVVIYLLKLKLEFQNPLFHESLQIRLLLAIYDTDYHYYRCNEFMVCHACKINQGHTCSNKFDTQKTYIFIFNKFLSEEVTTIARQRH